MPLNATLTARNHPRVTVITRTKDRPLLLGRCLRSVLGQSFRVQNASNRGLEAAAGACVAIHDDDDSWEPDFLRSCVDHLDKLGAGSTVQGVITQTTRVFEEFNAGGVIEELGREDYLPVENVELFAAGADNPFAPIAFVYRRAVHEQLVCSTSGSPWSATGISTSGSLPASRLA